MQYTARTITALKELAVFIEVAQYAGVSRVSKMLVLQLSEAIYS